MLSGVLIFSGCGTEEAENEKTANLAYVNWAEGVAYTNLAKVVLEEKMGYEVNITAADVGPAYTSVARGDMDAFMETWLPVLHKDYVDQYQEDIVDLGTVYDGTQSGFVVPDYVEAKTISDLKKFQDEFDGEITGIDAGAGVMRTAEEVMQKYELDEFELISSSGPAMTAALKDAIDNEEPIVVTGWKPHWMFGRWDLRFLEQDQEKVWDKGSIHIFGRKNIEEDKAELAQFLRNMKFTDAELADLMLNVERSDEDVEVVARKWMNENEDLVNGWIPKTEK